MKLKRGQGSGLEISVIILFIALMILVYVILLPPADRAELLNETLEDAEIPDFAVSGEVLLSESPGIIYAQGRTTQEANLEPMHLFSKQEKVTQSMAKSLSVSNNLIKDNYKELFVDIDSLNDLSDVQLVFLIRESKGDLKVEVNGRLIFEGEMTVRDLPLEIPLDYLTNGENKIRLSTDKRIFSSSYYLLNEVNIVKSMKRENKKSTRTFTIDENQRIKSGKLYYFLGCNDPDSEGRLSIKLNGKSALNDAIFCEYGDERELALSRSSFTEGRNKIEFSIDEGDYNLDEVRMEIKMDRADFPTYTFDISSELFNKLENEDRKIMIGFKFKGSGRKRATIVVQGEEFMFDTSGSEFEKDITQYVENGANSLKIIPKEDFEISLFKVFEEKV